KNVHLNGLLVKKILNAYQLLMIAIKNAELELLAGVFVFQAKVVKLLLMLLNALKLKDVIKLNNKQHWS
ncbi:MAG: hypothetical protein ACKO96_16050, partial [Flammeovirgaceae bacterium]